MEFFLLSRPAREESFPDLAEHLDNYFVVMVRVQGQEALEQPLQLLGSEHLFLDDHLHHRLPEISIWIARLLHHREAASDVVAVVVVHQQDPDI